MSASDQDCRVTADVNIPEPGGVLYDTCNHKAWIVSDTIINVQEAQ